MRNKCLFLLMFLLCSLFLGCVPEKKNIQIAATTLPVYEFTSLLCQDTDISVVRLVTEDISCLHNYSLQTQQMRLIEQADMIVVSGAGLESFLDDVLTTATNVLDASKGIQLHCNTKNHSHDDAIEHHHTSDPHIWLSPKNAAIMADNICNALVEQYPQYADIFIDNNRILSDSISEVSDYAASQLENLSHREIITFHDGFSYMAEAFDLKILYAIEEESGSEPSARELITLIEMIQSHQLPALFIEKNNPGSAAMIISDEINIDVFSLDMALSGDSYFTAMYHNIDTLKEALK